MESEMGNVAKPRDFDQPVIEALQEYISTDSKESWDRLYLLISKCIENLAKKEYSGVYNSYFEDRVSDATYAMMIKIRYYPKFKEEMLQGLLKNKSRHVTSYCYWPMLAQLRGRQARQEDSEYSYDAILEYNKGIESEGYTQAEEVYDY